MTAPERMAGQQQQAQQVIERLRPGWFKSLGSRFGAKLGFRVQCRFSR